MTALIVLGIVALLLLAPLAIAALRQRTLFTMASRNIGRRRAEAVLVVAGALLGTAIITSSLVVGDVIEASFADVARTQYGPIDITLTPTEGAIDDVEKAVGRRRDRRHRRRTGGDHRDRDPRSTQGRRGGAAGPDPGA